MAWYTDSSILSAFPSASELDAADLAQAAQDATTVYDYACQNAGISDQALRSWGETQGITPDRMNRAVALLKDAGRLYTLPDLGALAATTVVGQTALQEAFTVPELRKAAVRAGADVPKSATKGELARAIVETVASRASD